MLMTVSEVLKMFLTGTFSSCIFSFCFVPLTLWQAIDTALYANDSAIQLVPADRLCQAVFLIRTGIMGADMSSRDCERLLQPDELLDGTSTSATRVHEMVSLEMLSNSAHSKDMASMGLCILSTKGSFMHKLEQANVNLMDVFGVKLPLDARSC